jgi:hypothetical protein
VPKVLADPMGWDPGPGSLGKWHWEGNVNCSEFLSYLYDRPETRELARVLAAAALKQRVATASRYIGPHSLAS